MERIVIEERQKSFVPCPNCHGRGYFPVFTSCGVNERFIQVDVACSRCRGYGWVIIVSGLTIEITETSQEVAVCDA